MLFWSIYKYITIIIELVITSELFLVLPKSVSPPKNKNLYYICFKESNLYSYLFYKAYQTVQTYFHIDLSFLQVGLQHGKFLKLGQ